MLKAFPGILEACTAWQASGSSSTSGSGGSSSGTVAETDADGSFCGSCKLCQEELQQQQQQQQQRASAKRSSSSAGAQPLDTADPFMWRRLMWGLLGRIKPSARKLYAAEKHMCPHTSNTS
jgi:hypothetical protein